MNYVYPIFDAPPTTFTAAEKPDTEIVEWLFVLLPPRHGLLFEEAFEGEGKASKDEEAKEDCG